MSGNPAKEYHIPYMPNQPRPFFPRAMAPQGPPVLIYSQYDTPFPPQMAPAFIPVKMSTVNAGSTLKDILENLTNKNEKSEKSKAETDSFGVIRDKSTPNDPKDDLRSSFISIIASSKNECVSHKSSSQLMEKKTELSPVIDPEKLSTIHQPGSLSETLSSTFNNKINTPIDLTQKSSTSHQAVSVGQTFRAPTQNKADTSTPAPQKVSTNQPIATRGKTVQESIQNKTEISTPTPQKLPPNQQAGSHAKIIQPSIKNKSDTPSHTQAYQPSKPVSLNHVEKKAKTAIAEKPKKEIVKPIPSSKKEPEPSKISVKVTTNDRVKKALPIIIPTEEKTLIGKIVGTRRTYDIAELLEARSYPDSCIQPEMLKKANKAGEYYVKCRFTMEPKIQYKRSLNAWTSSKETNKHLSHDEVALRISKAKIQSAINRFTKNTSQTVYDDLSKTAYAEGELSEYMIDCIFRSVTHNGAWIMEYSQLCDKLLKFFESDSKNTKIQSTFRTRVVSRFTKATEISQDWIDNYEAIKNRKITTIEELDILNEELQAYERKRRSIVIGSAKVIAYFFNLNVISEEAAIQFINKYNERHHEMDIEVICSYLTLAGAYLKSVDCKKSASDIISYLEKNKNTYSSRIKFIIEDIISLRTALSTTKTSKAVTVTTCTSNLAPKRNSAAPYRITINRDKTADSCKNTFQYGFVENESVRPFDKTQRYRKPERNTDKPVTKHVLFKPTMVQEKEPVNPKVEFSYTRGQAALIPILQAYGASCDIHEFTYEFKELEIANHMSMFVKISFAYFTDRTEFNHMYFGQLLCSLHSGGRLNKFDFIKGFSEFLATFNDIIVDLPAIASIVAQCILPLLTSSLITFIEYYEVLVKSQVENPQNCLIDLLDELIKTTNLYTAIEFWNQSIMPAEFSVILSSSKYSFLLDPPSLPKVYISFKSFNDPSILQYEASSFLTDLQDASPIEMKLFINDFNKILHYCCPTSPSDAIISYLEKTMCDHARMIQIMVNKEENLLQFFKSLKDIYYSKFKKPFGFIRFFIQPLLRLKLVKLTSIEQTFSEINDDLFTSDLNSIKVSL